MKKNIVMISILLGIVYFIFTNYLLIKENILESINLFGTKVIVSLYPFIILAKLLMNYNLPYYLAKLFKSNYVYIYIIGLLSGAPNSFIVIKDLLENNFISLEEANSYVSCAFFSSPLFLYTMLRSFLPLLDTILIILASYLANVGIYFLVRKRTFSKLKKIEEKSLFDALMVAIDKSMQTLIMILGTIIFFNMLSTLIPSWLANFTGLLEITKGLDFLSNSRLSLGQMEILALIYINFGGLAIIMQVLMVIKNTPIKRSNFLISRFYQVIISIIIFILLRYLVWLFG